MKKRYSPLILLFILFSSCEESYTVKLDLEGAMKGQVNTMERGSFGFSDDNENILIELEGSEPLISAKTDSDGYYEINNIPPGTYNILISKEEYCPIKRSRFKIVGGEEPMFFQDKPEKKPQSGMLHPIK